MKNGLIIDIDSVGHLRWRKNGMPNRENDLPAIEYTHGAKEWWVNGIRHRLYGPAILSKAGVESWWLNGYRYGVKNKEHPFYSFRKEYNLPKTFNEWPNDMKMLFKLTYSGLV